MSPNHMAFVTAVAAEVSAVAASVAAIATVITAGIAAYAATRWRSGLKRQREDECVAALHGVAGEIGRVVSLKENQSPGVWEAHREAWASWRDFRRTFAVVRRYHASTLSREALQPGIKVMHGLLDLCREEGAGTAGAGKKLNSDFGVFTGRIEQVLEK